MYVAFTLLVCSNFPFEILSLDGSDTPSKPALGYGWTIEPDAGNEAERLHRSTVELWSVFLAVSLTRLAGLVSRHSDGGPPSSPLDSARQRGYAVALPRSSISDPTPVSLYLLS